MQLGFTGTFMPGTGLTPSDYNNRSLNVYSFNSGLVYNVTPDDVVRLMASRGYQLPSLNDLAQQILVPPSAGGPYFLLGQPYLEPTSVLNGEVDYDHKINAIGATLRTALYVQKNSNLFGYDAAGVAAGSQSSNIGDSNEIGGEIGLKGTSSSGIRWSTSYAYAQITDHVYPSIAPGVYTTYNGGTPRHTFDLGLGYTLGRWEFDTQGRWQSAFQDWRFPDAEGLYYPVTVKAYLTSNARVGFRPVEYLTLALSAEQFNQERIYERASIPVERRFIASATVRF
jgi:iron complex outermembrane receptor protein